MTLFELINAIDSDSMIITINGKSAIVFKKGQGDNILAETWRIEEGEILNLSKELLGAKVTNYAIKLMADEVPQVEVSLEGFEEPEDYENQREAKRCSGRYPWASEITLKSLLSLFGDQASSICIIRSGIGRIYSGSIGGFLSSVSEIYNEDVLNSSVDKVYNETDMETKKRTFFIRIGGSK